jgi:hypothetical protein
MPPYCITLEELKHAAEEFRHAHYLKRQITRVIADPLVDYSLPCLLGGRNTRHYLARLDVQTCRFLRYEKELSKQSVCAIAYLLVTYAIELRAEELYPLYDEALKKASSKVMVKSILLEEKEHLHEMRTAINALELGQSYAEKVCYFEGQLCQKWLTAVEKEVYR